MDSVHLTRIRGTLLGTAVGDSIGLPYEGMGPARVAAMAPPRLRQSFVMGRGMLSDDTEHTFLLGRALAVMEDAGAFEVALAHALKRWLWTLPGGIGLGTLRALMRLTVGFGPHRSGVDSAGNGPAMRAALLGVCLPEPKVARWVRAATRLTHTDGRAETGALAVAWMAHGPTVAELVERLPEDDVRQAILNVREAEDVGEMVRTLGVERGVSGFVVHTVPAALWVAERADSFEQAVDMAVRLGGDTDTMAAIVGALAGARFGGDAIPDDWLTGIADWPLGVDRLEALARALSGAGPVPDMPWLGQLVRNLGVFMPLVLLHGFRRLLPPYGLSAGGRPPSTRG